jgi:hypothetical protein
MVNTMNRDLAARATPTFFAEQIRYLTIIHRMHCYATDDRVIAALLKSRPAACSQLGPGQQQFNTSTATCK